MATHLQVFKVPLVFHNLREIEYQHQVVDALENLETVVDDVFSRITNRISTEGSKIQNIESRIESAKAKVGHIAATRGTKATSVFSAAKYPAAKQLDDYLPLYSDKKQGEPKHNRYHLSEEPHKVADNTLKDPAYDDPYLPESHLSVNRGYDVREGLGRLPPNLNSISSLLLFNSTENPYQKYVTIDTLAGKIQEPQQDEEPAFQLTEAPASLVDGDQLPSIGAIEYSFRPEFGAGPTFNLPAALPDLDMVADNISWGSGAKVPEFTPIAPSSHSHLVAQLPDLDLDLPESPTVQPTKPAAPSSAPPPPAAGPPPPAAGPPPPLGAGPPPPPSSAPPPPADGPPPPAPQGVPTEVAAPETGRSSLLADIRKGRSLKSAAQRDLADAPPSVSGEKKAPPPPSSSGNIFNDLLVALSRRHQSLKGEIEPTQKPTKSDEHIALPEPDEWAVGNLED